MSPSGTTCLCADCYFSQLALKISTKRVGLVQIIFLLSKCTLFSLSYNHALKISIYILLYFLLDFVPGAENYCVAARVMPNGYLQTFIKSCKDHLSSLCHADVITTDQITDTTPPYAITTEQITDTTLQNVTTTDKIARGRAQSTPSSRRNRSLPSTLSDGMVFV